MIIKKAVLLTIAILADASIIKAEYVDPQSNCPWIFKTFTKNVTEFTTASGSTINPLNELKKCADYYPESFANALQHERFRTEVTAAKPNLPQKTADAARAKLKSDNETNKNKLESLKKQGTTLSAEFNANLLNKDPSNKTLMNRHILQDAIIKTFEEVTKVEHRQWKIGMALKALEMLENRK